MKIWSADKTAVEISPSGRSVLIIDNENDFDKIIDNYVARSSLESMDYFTDGQVILIYDGQVNSCEEHLEFNESISASNVSGSSVKLILGYIEIPSDTKCSPTISNPFALYHIKTKKLLSHEQKIE